VPRAEITPSEPAERPWLRRTLLLLGVVGVLVLWLDSLQDHGALAVGKPLGEVQAEVSDGSVFRLSEHRGEVVVLSFWATWCGPCRREAPLLSRLRDRGTTVIGLSVEDRTLASLSQKARELGMHYLVGKGPDSVVERLGIRVVPTTLVVAKDGKVAASWRGPVGFDELVSAVASAESH
jgi:thiol-disulfide isomerase/thioredoxin